MSIKNKKKTNKKIFTKKRVFLAYLFCFLAAVIFNIFNLESPKPKQTPAPTYALASPDQMLTPDDATIKELATIIAYWVHFIQKKQWEKMIPLIQKTYKKNKNNEYLIADLEHIYGDETILSYEFGDLETRKNDVFYVLNMKVATSEGVFEMSPSLIKEIAPYKPDKNGTWGINPISAMLKNFVKTEIQKPK